MKKYSSIRVRDLLDSFLCPIKVIFEGTVIYDDTGDEFLDITSEYEDELVYNFYTEVVQFHHTIIEINNKE